MEGRLDLSIASVLLVTVVGGAAMAGIAVVVGTITLATGS
jgi:hypothetical protein